MRPFLTRLWAARRAILFYAILLTVGWLAGHLLVGVAIPEMRPMNEPLIHRIVMSALAIFVVTAAIPFVPGAEIGFGLLLLFGGQASLLVYTGMVGALLLSYSVARLVPLSALSSFAEWLGLKKIAALCDQLAQTPADARADFISGQLSGRFSSAVMRNRYLLLIVLLNMPGNSVLGGGGGIAFLAGVSGLYSFWAFLVSVLIAVAPFPLFFLLVGV